MTASNCDRTALVTGGSQGIGLGIARVFADSGMNVVITGRNKSRLDLAMSHLAGRKGTVQPVRADVTDRMACDAMVAHTVDAFGSLDVLCTNAGIYPRTRIEEISTEELDAVIRTNLYGTVFATQSSLPYLERSPNARIVVISSVTGPIVGQPGFAHYAASKSAQMGFVRSAAVELADKRITVNAVLPGTIREGQCAADPLAESIPLKRFGTFDEVGYAALYFASKEADFVTGQSIVIDGGQVLPERPIALASQ